MSFESLDTPIIGEVSSDYDYNIYDFALSAVHVNSTMSTEIFFVLDSLTNSDVNLYLNGPEKYPSVPDEEHNEYDFKSEMSGYSFEAISIDFAIMKSWNIMDQLIGIMLIFDLQ